MFSLQEFLFNTAEVNQDQTIGSIPNSDTTEMIQNLQNQLNILQQIVSHLENQNLEREGNLKTLVEETRNPFKQGETIEQGNWIIRTLLSSEIIGKLEKKFPNQRGKGQESNVLSEADIGRQVSRV